MSDLLVLLATALSLPLAAVLLARRGARGADLGAAVGTAAFGIFLVAAMTAHNVEVAVGWFVRERLSGDGPHGLDFRTYALFLLGGILTGAGVVALRAAPGVGWGLRSRRRSALRAVGTTLAVSVPLVAVHAFFGVLVTALGLVTALVLAAGGRPSGSTPEPASPDPPRRRGGEGPVALVVGTTRSGRALCRALLDAGATLYVADANLDVAAAAAVELGPGAHAIPLDPASTIDWQVACGYLRFEHGGADLVVRCGGPQGGPSSERPASVFGPRSRHLTLPPPQCARTSLSTD